MPLRTAALAFFLVSSAVNAGEGEVRVRSRNELAAAMAAARPGTKILIEPGTYEGGLSQRDLRGTAEKPIVIAAADPDRPPVFRGGGNGLHLSEPAHVELRDLVLTGGTGNGLNIDDGGRKDGDARHIVLRNLVVRDAGPRGNHDGIKLSGLTEFQVLDCTVERWGSSGSAIDMVGCRKGTVSGCRFQHANADFANGVQAKGGSRDVVIRRCRFENAGGRAVNIGGSTGLEYFRPRPEGFEARDVTVEDCTIVGSMAAIAFVGVDGAVVRHNTIYRPTRWVLRILQENQAADFVSCRNGRFENNVVVFRSTEVRTAVNVGGGTSPETFSFKDNIWHCADRPRDTQSLVRLPAAPLGDTYGVDPQLASPEKGDLTARATRAGVRPEKKAE